MLQRRMPGRLMGSVPLWGGGLGAFKFDPALVTFTAGMAKRLAPGPFETAPIVQGKWDSSGQPDYLTYSRGGVIAGDYWYSNFDVYQGSLIIWVTPEWDGNDNLEHNIWSSGSPNDLVLRKTIGNILEVAIGGQTVSVDISGWTAGTTYSIAARWDIKNTLDGTNYACVSINNVHTFGGSTQPNIPTPASLLNVGTTFTELLAADAIIEGLTFYRRPLFDGTYGVAGNWDDSGPIDEINAIYAAGVGQDPCLVTGSWDIVFCLPTDSVAGALTTGTGNAWSHPHSSGVLEHQWLEDGGYLGRPWAVAFNGTTTLINCGSGATLDDISAAVFTAETWVRADDYGEGGNGAIINKGRINSGGWRLMFSSATSAITAEIDFVTTNASVNVLFIPDGKCHHFTLYFDQGGDNKLYIAIDGKWVTSYVSQIAAVGAHVTDAADDLCIGARNDNALTTDGAIGWCALSDNDRYSHGTDFIPPRQPPATDGNHVEMWHIDEGTGATANAEVTSPANDGTISNGTWEEQWDQETSPIVPYSFEFDGTDTKITCADVAIIQDLADDAFTAEFWIREDGSGENIASRIVAKRTNGDGWNLFTYDDSYVIASVNCATTNAVTRSLAGSMTADGKWHHVVMFFDDAGDRKVHLAIDGIYYVNDQTAGVGAILSDVGGDLVIGNFADQSRTIEGAIGGGRISDNDRYTSASDTTFTPPSRLNPPGTDGNTVAQWNFRDGAGTTLLDETVNNIDGTITPGDGGWQITPDMEIDSPGERVFNWGYTIGNDAVDEGIKQTHVGLAAGQNYVVRAIAHVESASRGRPKIIVYDETNGAQITALEGPSFTGAHDGGAGVADLADSTARWPQMMVGWTLYNITDGSSTTVTGIDGDMQGAVGALAGGVTNLWNISDEYRFVPPGGPSEYDDYPWIETFTFELPTIARNGVAADCVSISVQLVNGVNEGVIKWHQVELLELLGIDNPSFETGGGNPWLPDGWVSIGLDPGDTLQENATVHSGGSSLEWAIGAIGNEGIGLVNAWGAIERFIAWGVWHYGDGTGEIGQAVPSDCNLHNGLSGAVGNEIVSSAKWQHFGSVWRATGGSNPDPRILVDNPVGTRYTDDTYAFALDDVSLTVTPASEANSAESGGLRIDGRDLCTQPIPVGMFTATSGWAKWKVILRHGDTDVAEFGVTQPRIATFWFDATHYIYIRWQAVNNLRVTFNDGGGAHLQSWATGGIIDEDVEYLLELKYNASEMILKIDGVTRITVVAPVNFANIPTIAYWATNQTGGATGDMVLIAP